MKDVNRGGGELDGGGPTGLLIGDPSTAGAVKSRVEMSRKPKSNYNQRLTRSTRRRRTWRSSRRDSTHPPKSNDANTDIWRTALMKIEKRIQFVSSAQRMKPFRFAKLFVGVYFFLHVTENEEQDAKMHLSVPL